MSTNKQINNTNKQTDNTQTFITEESTPQKSLTDIKKENIQQWIKPTDEQYQQLSFAIDSSVASSDTTINRVTSSRYNRVEDVQALIKNKYKMWERLQQISQQLVDTNGVYNRLVSYFAYMPTFYHYLYPALPLSQLRDEKKLWDSYEKCANYVEKMNIKTHFPYIAYKVILNGEAYLYKLEDATGIVYKEIPNSVCRVSHSENDVHRYQVNLAKITDSTVVTYPIEIQNAYATYKKSGGKQPTYPKDPTTKQVDIDVDGWYQVGVEGVAFPTVLDSAHSYPLFVSLLSQLLDVENVKEKQNLSDDLDTTKIIHGKIPVNNEGIPVMDITLAKKFNDSIVRTLPDGIVSIINPFDTEAINLSNSGATQQRDLLANAIEMIYKNAGVSDMLFSNQKASNEALKKSIAVDAMMVFSKIMPMFADYINSELLQHAKKNKLWKIRFLEMTYFDKDDMAKNISSYMAYGTSRLKYLSAQGYEPLEAVTLFLAEQTMKIDDIVVPKANSNTSDLSKVSTDEGGRPTTDNPSEATESGREQQS